MTISGHHLVPEPVLEAGVVHDRPRATVVKPIRVLALIDTIQVSGPCRGLFQLTKLARPVGGEVILGMFVRGGATTPAVEETRRRGYPVLVFDQRHRCDPGLVGQVLHAVRRSDIGVLQSHGYKPALLAWLVKRLTGLPWVAFAHGYTYEDRRVALYNALDRWLLRRADRVVVMSAVMAKQFVAAGVERSRIRVVHNAIDPAEYRLSANGLRFRQEHECGPGRLLLGVIGRFSSEKGQEPFLRALAEIGQTVPNVGAVLVGDGVDGQRLRLLTATLRLDDRVRFAGYRGDISEIYAGLDLVVIPSLTEGLPNVLLEALLHGKPVVATRVGAVPEVLTGELGRWLVPPGDVAALARTIAEALQDGVARMRFSQAGPRLVRASFSPDQRVALIMEMYRETVSAARRSRLE